MNTEQRVITLVAGEFGRDVEEITRETTFAGDLDADSLDTSMLAIDLENAFDLYVRDEEIETLETVGQVVDFIIEKGR